MPRLPCPGGNSGPIRCGIGGQTRPIDSFAQMTVGNAVSTDHTPMIGAMDSPAISGAKAGGNSGNPDTGYGLSPGDLEDIERLIRELERQRRSRIPVPMAASMDSNSEGWSITDGHGNWTGPYRPPADILPGFGTADAPPNAPNDQQSQMTQADQRLAGTWPEQEFYGAKPGKQLGSIIQPKPTSTDIDNCPIDHCIVVNDLIRRWFAGVLDILILDILCPLLCFFTRLFFFVNFIN